MSSPTPSKKGTNQFMRQGHTASIYGNDPSANGKGQVAATPKELKA